MIAFAFLILVQPTPQEAALSDTVSLFERAHTALETGRFEESRSLYEECRERQPSNPTFAFHLACACERLDESEDALGHLMDAARNGYQDAAVARWTEHLIGLRTEGRFHEALKAMEEDARRRRVVRSPESVAWLDPRSERVHASYLRWQQVDTSAAHIAVGLDDGSVRVYDSATGRLVLSGKEHESAVRCIDLHPRGSRLLSAAVDGIVTLWDLESGEPLHRLVLELREHDEPSARFSPDGMAFLVHPVRGGGAELWDTRDLVRIARFEGPFDSFPEPTFSPDGRLLAAVRGSGIQLLDPGSGEATGVVLDVDKGDSEYSFHPDGTRILVAGRNLELSFRDTLAGDRTALPFEVWDRGNVLTTARDVEIDASGRFAVLTTGSLYVRLIDLERMEDVWIYHYPGGQMSSLQADFTRDGTRLLCYGNSHPRILRTGDGLVLFGEQDTGHSWFLEVASGELLAAGRGSALEFLNAKTLEPAFAVAPYDPRAGVFEPRRPAYVRSRSELQALRLARPDGVTPLTDVASLLVDPIRVAAREAGVEVREPNLGSF